MKKSIKVLSALMIVFVLLTTSIGSAFAERWKNSGDNEKFSFTKQNNKGNAYGLKGKLFSDMNEDFWAYKAIEELVKRGIINGYNDNTFKPNEKVTRSEFATMLTKALKLTSTNTTQTFVDVKPNSWDYKAVEASQNYLTGYKTSSGAMYFYGGKNAVREDMAVALVKALNLTIQAENGQLQTIFSDYSSISENLKDYIYTAYKEGIMVGSNGKFAPQNSLTRAEAATLLNRALQKTEKVVVGDGSNDDQKVVVSDPGQVAEKSHNAALYNLTIDGVSIANFSANVYDYNVILAAGTTRIPSVAAAVYDTGKATEVITQATGLPGAASVVVTAEDATTKSTYKVNFSVSQ